MNRLHLPPPPEHRPIRVGATADSTLLLAAERAAVLNRDRQIAKALREYAAAYETEMHRMVAAGSLGPGVFEKPELARDLAAEIDPDVTP